MQFHSTFSRVPQPVKLTSSGANPEDIVQRHINLLHTYNEIKDVTQALIGRVSWVLAVFDEDTGGGRS